MTPQLLHQKTLKSDDAKTGAKLFSHGNFVFYHEVSIEDSGIDGFTNNRQTGMCIDVLLHLEKTLHHDQKILVLAAYDKHLEDIRMVSAGTGACLKIIDDYQESEADVIVIVTTRSNLKQLIGPMKKYRNVLDNVYKSKTPCIIIGDATTLKADLYWRNVLNYISDRGKFIKGVTFSSAVETTREEIIQEKNESLVHFFGLHYQMTFQDFTGHIRNQFHMYDVEIKEWIHLPEDHSPFKHFLGGYSGNFVVRTGGLKSTQALLKLNCVNVRHRHNTRKIEVRTSIPTPHIEKSRVVFIRGFHRFPNQRLEEEREWIQCLFQDLNIQAYEDYRNGPKIGDFSIGLVFPTSEMAEEVVACDGKEIQRSGYTGRFQAWFPTHPDVITEMLARADGM